MPNDLDSMTKAELIEFAEDEGISVRRSGLKSEVRAEIDQALTPALAGESDGSASPGSIGPAEARNRLAVCSVVDTPLSEIAELRVAAGIELTAEDRVRV